MSTGLPQEVGAPSAVIAETVKVRPVGTRPLDRVLRPHALYCVADFVLSTHGSQSEPILVCSPA